MKKNKRPINKRVLYTIMAVLALSTVFVSVLWYALKDAENNGYENLHFDTKEIKDSINIQIISDMENLSTIALFASKLHTDGEDFTILLDSFKPVGLIENIGILMPDNTIITKKGRMDVSAYMTYKEEIEKGNYISGRVADVTNPQSEVIVSAVPVTAGQETIGILYGIINPDTFTEKYMSHANERGGHLYIIEQKTGKFVIDTLHDEISDIYSVRPQKFKSGFSFEKMESDIRSGNSGYTSFWSTTAENNFYAHYSALDVGDWQIMLSKPESIVFEEARVVMKRLIVMFILAVVIMSLYLIAIFSSERKIAKLSLKASKIRRLLLRINQKNTDITEALKDIADFAESKIAFYIDTEGTDYSYMASSEITDEIYENIKCNFILELLTYANRKRNENKEAIIILEINANAALKEESPELYAMLNELNMSSINFAVVSNRRDVVSILGTLDSTKKEINLLLKDIAVCFSMAIYNKNYMNETEMMAHTDSLTGLFNRLQLKTDMEKFDKPETENLACVYIDVNELHMFNNKYGHTAGDSMLINIANALKQVFEGNKYLYRMGGDEFLVLVENVSKGQIIEAVHEFVKKVEAMNYHVSVGIEQRTTNVSTEEVLKIAEKRMYDAKAEYYQNKNANIEDKKKTGMLVTKTGVHEVDAALSMMGNHYHAVMGVSLEDDSMHSVLMPEYLSVYFENEPKFSKGMLRYINELVTSDYHRPLRSFLEYDVLEHQLQSGNIPSIKYINSAGDSVTLRVYPTKQKGSKILETLWAFEKL